MKPLKPAKPPKASQAAQAHRSGVSLALAHLLAPAEGRQLGNERAQNGIDDHRGRCGARGTSTGLKASLRTTSSKQPLPPWARDSPAKSLLKKQVNKQKGGGEASCRKVQLLPKREEVRTVKLEIGMVLFICQATMIPSCTSLSPNLLMWTKSVLLALPLRHVQQHGCHGVLASCVRKRWRRCSMASSMVLRPRASKHTVRAPCKDLLVCLL